MHRWAQTINKIKDCAWSMPITELIHKGIHCEHITGTCQCCANPNPDLISIRFKSNFCSVDLDLTLNSVWVDLIWNWNSVDLIWNDSNPLQIHRCYWKWIRSHSSHLLDVIIDHKVENFNNSNPNCQMIEQIEICVPYHSGYFKTYMEMAV